MPHIAGKLRAFQIAEAFSKACAVQMASKGFDSAYGEEAQGVKVWAQLGQVEADKNAGHVLKDLWFSITPDRLLAHSSKPSSTSFG